MGAVMPGERTRYHVKNWRAPRLAADPAIAELAGRLGAELAARTPRGPTGELAASWEVRRGRVAAAYLVSNDDPALKYVEYGTKNMRAEPFVGPVLAQYRAAVAR